MNEIVASSWPDLMEHLFVDSWDARIMRHRSPYAFRGLSDENYVLSTRLMRLGGDFANLEKHLLRSFRRYALRDVEKERSLWKWLAVAQHHGLPTRLLDWTYSPFVALHFATYNIERYEVNGAIWCVNFIEVNKRAPRKIRRLIEAEDALNFTVEMLEQVAKSLQEFDAIAAKNFVAFFDPPSLNERIANQYALFSTMSTSQGLLNEWLKWHQELFRKIVIPAPLKWEIRDKLDKGNITERILFPGLDGLASWLTRYYSPGPRLGKLGGVQVKSPLIEVRPFHQT